MQNYHRIRDLREDSDRTQPQCAELLYVSKNSYIRYENGERIPPFDFICRVAELYGVSIDYIAGRTNIKAVNK